MKHIGHLANDFSDLFHLVDSIDYPNLDDEDKKALNDLCIIVIDLGNRIHKKRKEKTGVDGKKVVSLFNGVHGKI